MNRIVKRNRSFIKYQHWIFAAIWFCLGVGYNFYDEPLTFAFFAYMFLAFGQIGLHIYYQQKGRDEESISWNEEKFIVQELFQKPKIYPVSKIDNLAVTPNNFIIKSGSARGAMVDLKGFSKEEIVTLKSDAAVIFPSSEVYIQN